MITSCPSGFKLVNPKGIKCCYCEPIPTTTAATTPERTTIHVTTVGTTPAVTTVGKTTGKPTTAQTTPKKQPTTAAPVSKCVTEKKTEIYKDSENCTSKRPIEKTKCKGQCPSETIFDVDQNTALSDCKCCKPFEYRKTSVELECPDGRTKLQSYYIFLSCSCYGCSVNPFGKDLPLVSSDEYEYTT